MHRIPPNKWIKAATTRTPGRLPRSVEEHRQTVSARGRPAYERIYALGEERLATFNAMLLGGKSITYVVKYVRDNWGHWKELKDAALSRQILAYRNKVIRPIQARNALHSGDGPDHVNKALGLIKAQLEATLDTATEMEKVILAQIERVEKLKTQEAKMAPGIVMDSLTKNLNTLFDMLDKYGKFQLEVGILKRVPKKVAIESPFTSEAEEFFENARLTTTEETVVAAALNYLKDSGIIDVPVRDVTHERDSENPDLLQSDLGDGEGESID